MKKLLEMIGTELGLKKKDSDSKSDFYFYRDGIKSDKSIKEKVERDYKGDFSKLKDITGGTFVINDENIDSSFEKIVSSGVLDIFESKKPKSKEGYWDYKITYYLPNGSIGELIILTPYMYNMKESIGHPIYEIVRSIAAAYEYERNEVIEITSEQEKFLNEIDASLSNIMATIYSSKNWSFDSISNALSLLTTKLDSGRVLVNGLTTNLSSALSKDNVTNLGLELAVANKTRLSLSSGSQTLNKENLSNSDLSNIKPSRDIVTEKQSEVKKETPKKTAVVETVARTKTFAQLDAERTLKRAEAEALAEVEKARAEAKEAENLASTIHVKDIKAEQQKSKTGNINEMDTSIKKTSNDIAREDSAFSRYAVREGLKEVEEKTVFQSKGFIEAGKTLDTILTVVSKLAFNGMAISNKDMDIYKLSNKGLAVRLNAIYNEKGERILNTVNSIWLYKRNVGIEGASNLILELERRNSKKETERYGIKNAPFLLSEIR